MVTLELYIEPQETSLNYHIQIVSNYFDALIQSIDDTLILIEDRTNRESIKLQPAQRSLNLNANTISAGSRHYP